MASQPKKKILLLGPSGVGKSRCIKNLKDVCWAEDMDRMINTTRSYDQDELNELYEKIKCRPSDVVSVSVLRPFLLLLSAERKKSSWNDYFSSVVHLKLSDKDAHADRLGRPTTEGKIRPEAHVQAVLSKVDEINRICADIADVTIDVDRLGEDEVADTVARHCLQIMKSERTPGSGQRVERAHGRGPRAAKISTAGTIFNRYFWMPGRSQNRKESSKNMVQFISKEEYEAETKAIGGKHWVSAGSRWAYHELAASWAKELNLSSGDNVLEMGPMGVTIVKNSRTMDYDASKNNVDWLVEGYQPTYLFDARRAPWPFDNKEFELIVSLRVFHHLTPRQRESFREARRVAAAMILVVPSKSVHPRGIDRSQLIEWNDGVAPAKERQFPGQLGDCYLFRW